MAPTTDARPAIRRAALDLFAEKGFDAASVQEIVDRAGVTKGALYHYFESKADILFEIYGSVFEHELDSLKKILAAGNDPCVTLREIIVDLVVTTAENAKTSAVFTRGAASADGPRWEAMQEKWREYQAGVRKVISEGQRSGVFSRAASPEVISWSIFGFTNTLHTWFRPDGPKNAAETGTELADLILGGLQAD